jgi:hypothetical protein
MSGVGEFGDQSAPHEVRCAVHKDARHGLPRPTERMMSSSSLFAAANIERFKQMLDAETDPTKRAILSRLLAKQEVELKEANETPTKKPN